MRLLTREMGHVLRGQRFRKGLAGLLLLVGMGSLGVGMAKDSLQQSGRLETSVPVQLDYLIALPKDYDKEEKWPLLLFLHGKGERGDDLNLVKVHGPPKLIDEGMEFPFVVVSPQCPEDQWWQPVELIALLDEIVAKYNVDEDRIYVTGLSMGGYGTWSLAHHAPRRFAAIAPICGPVIPNWAKDIPHVPVWVFHGAKDETVPVEWSEEIVEKLEEEMGDVRLTIYPDAGHDSWTESYANPKLYEWLLSHRRQQPAPAPAESTE